MGEQQNKVDELRYLPNEYEQVAMCYYNNEDNE